MGLMPVRPTGRSIVNEHVACPSPAAGEAIAAARGELSRLLASFRHRAGLSQRDLARMISYSPTTVASAEKGRPYVSAEFWKLADAKLGADGQLVAGYERVRCLHVWARAQARGDGPAPQDGQPAPLPGITSAGEGRTLTTPAIGVCPNCRQPFALVTELAVPASEPATNPPSRL